MSITKKVIVYPIDVEICRVTRKDHEVNSFSGPLVDFSMLPHRGNAEECLPPRLTPNISENMVSKTFEATSYPLEPGVHLHWSLPKVLRTAHIQDPKSQKGNAKESKITYRKVPNRWLIQRTVEFHKTQNIPVTNLENLYKTFIIESDLLSTGDPEGSKAFPYKPDNYKQGDVLYRYIGKCWKYDDWKKSEEQNNDENKKIYHKDLNAFGYGEPLYSAYYPECRNVFGFHDDLELDAEGVVEGKSFTTIMDIPRSFDINYKIIGFYDDISNDPIYLANVEQNIDDPFYLTFLNEKKYIFKNIRFETNKAIIKEDSLDELNKLSNFLNYYPLVTIKLTGHTDSVGSSDNNKKLSQMRADSVKDFLVSKGISEHRVTSIGYGEEFPIDSNATRSGRAENRRIECEFIELNLSKADSKIPSIITNTIQESRFDFSFNWNLISDNPVEKFEDGINARLLCSGQISVKWDRHSIDELNETKKLSKTNIALGNTAGQAFSALIANLSDSSTSEVENKELMLDALQLGLLTQLDEPDLIPKIDAGIHQSSFIPEDGGHFWRIQVKANEKEMENKQQSDPFAAGKAIIAGWNESLRELNSYQQKYDKLRFDISTLQKQLYADWYKFMTAEYNLRLGPITQRAQVNEIREHLLKQMDRLLDKFRELDINLNLIKELSNKIKGSLNEWSHEKNKTRKIYQLEKVIADRFWSPSEPSIIFYGDDAKLSERHHNNDMISVRCFDLALNWELRELTKGLKEKILINSDGHFFFPEEKTEVVKDENWTPLYLDWQVKLYPITKPYDINNDQMPWQRNSILKKFELDSGEIDLKLHDKSDDFKKSFIDLFIQNDSTKIVQTIDGRSILTSKAHESMVQGVKDALIELDEQPSENTLKDEKKVFDKETLIKAIEDVKILSQNLSGLNDAYLMQKQILQLSVFDPLADSKVLDDFTNKMLRKLIGNGNTTSPLPHNLFLPIREGYLRISRLQFVDTFGRRRYWEDEDNLTDGTLPIIAESLKKSKDAELNTKNLDDSLDESKKNHVKYLNNSALLPPRLSQPSRIKVKLHDALDSRRFSISQNNFSTDFSIPEESDLGFNPVCGWLMPNFLDQTLYVYDAVGLPLQKIGIYSKADHSQTLQISTIPGFNSTKTITNDFLNNTLNYITKLSVADFKKFLNTTFESLKTIEPKNHNQFSGTALLMGKPLALIRTTVSLDLKGEPAIDHNWQKRLKTYLGEAENEKMVSQMGFTRAKFPIRLGSISQANDGLVGYFILPKSKPIHFEENDPFAYEYTYNEFYAGIDNNEIWKTKVEYEYKVSEKDHLITEQTQIEYAQVIVPIIEGILKKSISDFSEKENDDLQRKIDNYNQAIIEADKESLFYNGKNFSADAINKIEDISYKFLMGFDLINIQSYANLDFNKSLKIDEKDKIEWLLSTIESRKDSFSVNQYEKNRKKILELEDELGDDVSQKSQMDSKIYKAPKPEHLSLSADGKPLEVLMLVDPRANVHITSGILPVKSVAIRPDAIADAIKNIEMSFLTAPILTPDFTETNDEDFAMNNRRKDKLLIPTMKEDDISWSWLEQDKKESWKTYPPEDILNPPERKIGITNKLTLREGWLKLGKNKPE